MEEIKSNVALLLEGKPYEEMHEFCDFTLEEQNELQVAKGVQPTAPNEFKPIIKKNVSYIVAAVLINDQGEVLMMQEAKSTCAGQWYLPAGRMEPGEDITEAAQREVLEETGLHFQLTTLLMVESAGTE
jgi:8-oxo-dGDP phosphatase